MMQTKIKTFLREKRSRGDAERYRGYAENFTNRRNGNVSRGLARSYESRAVRDQNSTSTCIGGGASILHIVFDFSP